MRILRLDLLAFGPFTDEVLDLAADGPALHVVHGPNEAGKSTTRRAISGLLFGIEERTPDAHRHPMPKLRVGAVLLGGDGRRQQLLRRKGRKGTLTDGAGEPVDEAVVRALLAGVDQQRFQAVHSLDSTSLRSGAEALLAGRGDVGETLFDAASGGRHIHGLLADLAAQADALFAPQGKVKPLNRALADLAAAQKRCRDLGLSASEWERQEQALGELQARLAALEERRRQLDLQRRRLELVLRVLPSLVRRRELLEQRQAIDGAAALASLSADEVARLRDDLASSRRMRSDLPKREEDKRRHEERARALLAELGRADDLHATTPLDGEVRKRIRQLARERGLVDERLLQARRDLAREEAARARAAAELDALPAARPLAGLRAALEAGRGARHEENDLARARAELERGRVDVQAELPRFTGDADALLALAVPSAEAVGEHVAAADERARRRAALDEQALDLRRRERENARRLDEQRLAGEVATEEHLRAARRRRDEHLAALREGEAGDWDAALDAVAASDEVADRLWREAERVAQHAALQAERVALRREEDELATRRAALEDEAGRAAQDWAALWRPSGLSPGSPREMAGWLGVHASVVARVRETVAREAALAARQREVDAARRRLAEVLADDGGEAPSPAAPLAELVEHASERLSGLERQQERRRHLEETLRDESALAARRAEVEAAEAAHARWRDEWAEGMARLLLPPEAPSEEAEGCLERLDELQRCLDARRQVQDRIDTMTRDLDAFESCARPLLAAAPGALADDAPLDDRVRDLVDRHARLLEKETLLRDCEDVLIDAGEGRGIDELLALTRDVDAQEARARLEEIERELGTAVPRSRLLPGTEGAGDEPEPEAYESLQDEIERLQREVYAAQSGLQRFRAGSAAEAAEEVATHLAEVRALARQHAGLRLAARMLRDEVERFRQENQDPLLQRAEELFVRLTRGAWEGLRAGPGEGGAPVLVCLRPGEEVQVDGLSSGTRDQLYLALRVAALERQAQAGEPMPLLLDDALVEFDDARLEAAMEVLGELAATTQVLYFTHHEAHVQVARRVVPEARLAVHRLGAGRTGIAAAG